MSTLGRFIRTVLGLSRGRIPRQLELLGAPSDLVSTAKKKPDIEQEEILLQFVEGKHAAVIDWRAERDDVYDALFPILSTGEKALLPPKEDAPDSASGTIARIREALTKSDRALIQTESFGDFSFLFLVPRVHEEEFLRCASPWLIQNEK